MPVRFVRPAQLVEHMSLALNIYYLTLPNSSQSLHIPVLANTLLTKSECFTSSLAGETQPACLAVVR